AISGPFLVLENRNGLAEDIRDHLLPERTPRTASREANRFSLCTHLFDDVEAVLLTVRHAFQQGPDQVCPPVFCGKSNPAAACRSIEMRRAFSHQIRKPVEPLRSGGCGCNLSRKRIVEDPERDVVSKPLQAESRSLSDTHHIPRVFDRMTERVNAAARIIFERRHVYEDDSRCPKRAGYLPRLDNPVSNPPARLVSSPANDRGALGQTGQLGGRSGNPAADVAGLEHRRQNAPLYAGSIRHPLRPSAMHDIEKCGA